MSNNKILIFSFLFIFNLCFAVKNPLPIVDPNHIQAFETIFTLLTPYNVNNYTKIRLGKKNDGGYIVPIEMLKKLESSYTYGAGNDISFEINLSKLNKNTVIRIYDHTSNYPKVIKNNIFFKKEGLAATQTKDLNTLFNHIKENQDQDKDILLKLDIEGAEWDILDKLDKSLLNNVIMIVIEFHHFEQVNKLPLYKRVLEKLHNSFTVFHIHPNNCSFILSVNNKNFPNVIEVTYINNKYVKSKRMLGAPLSDTREITNCPGFEGHFLNFWLI